MKRHAIITALLILIVGCSIQTASAQLGILTGYVIYEADGLADTVAGARVWIDFIEPSSGTHFDTLSSNEGQFTFEGLVSGVYSVAASTMGLGFATEVVEVDPRIPTHVVLSLTDGVGIGEYDRNLSAQGIAVVRINPRTNVEEYYLDVGGDSTLDYRLSFGAPWYVPLDPFVQRPMQGDPTYISGAPFGYSPPPIVIVRELNNQTWRDSTDHGGVFSELAYALGCTTRVPIRIEANGWVDVQHFSGPPDSDAYIFHWNMDSILIGLDFGVPSYSPDTDAARPENHDVIDFVGGLLYCDQSQTLWATVYEINGLLWRLPGDTAGLAIPVGTAADPITVPVNHLMASNYPNPFNPSTTILYSIPETGRVRVSVYDIQGRLVDTLLDAVQAMGHYGLLWDGSAHSAGIYIYEVSFKKTRIAHCMVLLK